MKVCRWEGEKGRRNNGSTLLSLLRFPLSHCLTFSFSLSLRPRVLVLNCLLIRVDSRMAFSFHISRVTFHFP